MNSNQFATIIVRSVGFVFVVCGLTLLTVRGINAIGRLPWSYIGSFVREALVAPAIFVIVGGLIFVLAKTLGGWLGKV